MNRLRLAFVCAGLAVLLAATPGAASSPFHVIATGLLNPRGLALGPNGRLYVVEAGVGAGTDTTAIGPTGRIIAIVRPDKAHPWIHTVRTGITSIGSQSGQDTEGVDGISVDSNGVIWAIVGGSAKLAGTSDPRSASCSGSSRTARGRRPATSVTAATTSPEVPPGARSGRPVPRRQPVRRLCGRAPLRRRCRLEYARYRAGRR